MNPVTVYATRPTVGIDPRTGVIILRLAEPIGTPSVDNSPSAVHLLCGLDNGVNPPLPGAVLQTEIDDLIAAGVPEANIAWYSTGSEGPAVPTPGSGSLIGVSVVTSAAAIGGVGGSAGAGLGALTGVSAATSVAAISGAGASGATAPSAPTGISSTAGDGQLTITWTAGTGATSSQIRYGTASGVYGTTINPATSPQVISGLTNGAAIYYQVGATNGSGTTWSAEQSAMPVVAATIPATPTGVALTAGNGQLTVNWTDVSGETTYNVYYSIYSTLNANGMDGALDGYSYPPDATSGKITGIAANSVSQVITGLTNGTNYYVRVSAVNSAGESSLAAAVIGTPNTPFVADFVGAAGAYTSNLDFDAYTAGAGTVTLDGTGRLVMTSAATTDGMMVFRKTPFMSSAARTYKVKAKAVSGTTLTLVRALAVLGANSTFAPTTITALGSIENSRIEVFFVESSGLKIRIAYISASTGGSLYWDTVTHTWVTTGQTDFAASYDTDYVLAIASDGSSMALTLKTADEATTLVAPASVPWSSIGASGYAHSYICWGDLRTDGHTGEISIDWYKEQ
jgi:hypothetical protein